jgi:hypothetical protein
MSTIRPKISPISTTTTTTPKPVPCELPSTTTKKPDEKPEENSNEDINDTTIKPKTKSSRRRRSVMANKRCIGRLFDGFRNGPILGVANPAVDDSSLDSSDPVVGARHADAADCDRYESDSELALKVNVGDNHAEESILQAVPTKKQLWGGKLSLGAPEKLFKNLAAGQKNEVLMHGRVPSSEESIDVSRKAMESESDSAQEESVDSPVVEAFPPPQFSHYEPPSQETNDYLPSYEYFPQNRPQHDPQAPYQEKPTSSVVVGPSPMPLYEHKQHDFSLPPLPFDQPQLPQNAPPSAPKPFVIGPSAVKSQPLYDHLSAAPSEVAVAKPHHVESSPPGCRCDPEQFNDLLHHMQTSYTQFHRGMIQLFDTFKSQVNCGSNTPRITDSSSSPSTPDLCRDRNHVNADPELAKSCQKYFADANVDPSSGYYVPPGAEDIQRGGFKNQFMSYADYLKMIQNVNYNAASVLSSSSDLDDDIVNAARDAPDNDSHEKTVNQLRSHIDHFQEPTPEPEIVAETEKPKTLRPFKFPSFPRSRNQEIVAAPQSRIPAPKTIKPIILPPSFF